MSRAQLTSTDQQNSGGAVAPFVAGKNKFISGDFGIWQRGTSFTLNGSGANYTADRWIVQAANNLVASQVAFDYSSSPASDKLPISGYSGTYFLRFVRSTSTGSDYVYQKIEDVHTFAGQTVTFSFWAKASSAITAGWEIDQSFGSGGSTGVSVFGSINIGTSWNRYSITTTLGSIVGKTIGANSNLLPALQISNTSGNITFDTWGWQIEAGSVATPFTTASGTLQGELALVQRYYVRWSGNQLYGQFGIGFGRASGATADVLFNCPVTMRATPQVVDYANLQLNVPGSSGATVTNIVASDEMHTLGGTVIVTASVTSGKVYFLGANTSTSAYIGLSAEL
jgi:hypothetical protein